MSTGALIAIAVIAVIVLLFVFSSPQDGGGGQRPHSRQKRRARRQPQHCGVGPPCKDNETCVDGECRRNCGGRRPCPPGEICAGGRCRYHHDTKPRHWPGERRPAAWPWADARYASWDAGRR